MFPEGTTHPRCWVQNTSRILEYINETPLYLCLAFSGQFCDHGSKGCYFGVSSDTSLGECRNPYQFGGGIPPLPRRGSENFLQSFQCKILCPAVDGVPGSLVTLGYGGQPCQNGGIPFTTRPQQQQGYIRPVQHVSYQKRGLGFFKMPANITIRDVFCISTFRVPKIIIILLLIIIIMCASGAGCWVQTTSRTQKKPV